MLIYQLVMDFATMLWSDGRWFSSKLPTTWACWGIPMVPCRFLLLKCVGKSCDILSFSSYIIQCASQPQTFASEIHKKCELQHVSISSLKHVTDIAYPIISPIFPEPFEPLQKREGASWHPRRSRASGSLSASKVAPKTSEVYPLDQGKIKRNHGFPK